MAKTVKAKAKTTPGKVIAEKPQKALKATAPKAAPAKAALKAAKVDIKVATKAAPKAVPALKSVSAPAPAPALKATSNPKATSVPKTTSAKTISATTKEAVTKASVPTVKTEAVVAPKAKPEALMVAAPKAAPKAPRVSAKANEEAQKLIAKWQSLFNKSKTIKTEAYSMKNTYERQTAINHKALGWGYILDNKNDRLEVLFKDGIRILISNYK